MPSALQTELRSELQRVTAAARQPSVAADEPRHATAAAHGIIAHRGAVVAQAHAGYAELFTDPATLAPKPRALGSADIFDVASLTKIFVAVTALCHLQSGDIDLQDTVVSHLPDFSGAGREEVRIRHLLTHTSGLPAIFNHWDRPADRAERIGVVLSQQLQHRPGQVHTYSCVGYQLLGLLLERRAGRRLGDLIATRLTDPLGLSETAYAPVDTDRVVPTEHQTEPPRGIVRGEVHDEAAWVLGQAGNAGLFSTATDMLRFAEAIRGAHDPITPQIQELLGTDHLDPAQREAAGYGQGVGLRIGDASFMGSDADGLLGHTGFTGTSMVIDPARELSVVLLTNRVHPLRSAFTVQPLRRRVVDMAQQWVDQQAITGTATATQSSRRA